MAGIFGTYGVYTMGFDMDPSGAEVFNLVTHGAAVTSPTPFSFGYGWQLGNTNAGILLGTNLTTLIIGARFYTTTIPTSSSAFVFGWYDATAGGFQVTLQVTSTGALQFYLGNSTATPIGPASAAGIISPNTWNPYLECTVTISATVGFVECRANGVTVITTAATQNTKNTANTFVNGFQFSSVGSATTTFDDWYMLDTTAASPYNTYLCPSGGGLWIRGDAPNANSATGGRNAWTPTSPTGANFSNNANIPFSATEFDADSNPGDYDMFRYPALPSSVITVLLINEWAVLDLDAAGARTVELNCHSNGTDSPSAAFTPATGTPTLYNQVSLVDPHTGSAWTVANAGVAEFGVKVQT
jgi:hypothetical protein